MAAKVYMLELENGTYVYLCPQHLKDWRVAGGKEKAKVATGRDCDHCAAGGGPGSSWSVRDDDA